MNKRGGIKRVPKKTEELGFRRFSEGPSRMAEGKEAGPVQALTKAKETWKMHGRTNGGSKKHQRGQRESQVFVGEPEFGPFG